MTPEVRYDEDADMYELGAQVDGVFVAFTTLPGTTVRARVEAVKATREQETPAAQ